jgi:hypothetical protein
MAITFSIPRPSKRFPKWDFEYAVWQLFLRPIFSLKWLHWGKYTYKWTIKTVKKVWVCTEDTNVRLLCHCM